MLINGNCLLQKLLYVWHSSDIKTTWALVRKTKIVNLF